MCGRGRYACRRLSSSDCLLALAPVAAKAEFQLSVYGGANTANDSDVTLESRRAFGRVRRRLVRRFLRTSRHITASAAPCGSTISTSRTGASAIDFTHAKVKADLDDPVVGARFDRLEFTNGLNSLTLNGLYRMPLDDRFTLYAGAGAGASIPHVEVETFPATARHLRISGDRAGRAGTDRRQTSNSPTASRSSANTRRAIPGTRPTSNGGGIARGRHPDASVRGRAELLLRRRALTVPRLREACRGLANRPAGLPGCYQPPAMAVDLKHRPAPRLDRRGRHALGRAGRAFRAKPRAVARAHGRGDGATCDSASCRMTSFRSSTARRSF